MDLFTRFNRKRIDDRQIDSLVGICKGPTADGKIDQKEAEFLRCWLTQSRAATNNPVILNLLEKVSAMLDDRALDSEESLDLLGLWRGIAKTASLPIDRPPPEARWVASGKIELSSCP